MVTARPFADAAARWASTGAPVFPVWGVRDGHCLCGGRPRCKPGKHPMSALAPHGHLDATTDPATIALWARRAPNANIGTPTGSTFRLWVLDEDPRHGGTESLARLVSEHGPLPPTRTTATPSGGRHYWFHHPGGVLIKSVAAPPRLGSGLDVKARGGYVILPPSNGAPTGAYSTIDRSLLASDAPTWLLDLVVTVPEQPRPVATGATPWVGSRYVFGAIRNEVDRVAHASAGTRNCALNAATFNLATLAGAGLLRESDVAIWMLEAAGACGLPAAEARATIASAMRAGMQHPRALMLAGASR